MRAIQKKHKLNKRGIIIAIAILLLIGIGAAAYYWQTRDASLSNEELTRDVDQTSAVKPDQTQGDANNGAEPLQKPSQRGGATGNTDDGTDGNADADGTTPEKPRVTRSEQTGDIIKVVALFHQQSTGSCELRLSQAGQSPFSSSAGIILGSGYYVCSFNIPRNNLPAGGKWEAVVLHKIGGTSTASESKTIQVE